MSFFKRVKDVTAANVNSWLDKVEDPVKLLEQYMRNMEKEISQAEVQVSKQIAVATRFKQQLDAATTESQKRAKQAEDFILADRDDLAQQALNEKARLEEEIQVLSVNYEQHQAAAEQLKVQLLEMKNQYREMQSKKQLLVARAESAKLTKNMNQTVTGFGRQTAAKGFSRMEQKVLGMEAEAEASKQLYLETATQKTLDEEYRSIQSSPTATSLELEELKRKLGKA